MGIKTKWLATLTVTASMLGCAPAVSKVKAPTPSNAFGDSNYRMIPVPSEDDSILGRILMEEPAMASSFEAEARPNPCAQHLATRRDDTSIQEIHRAQALGTSVEAGATLNGFGFSTESNTETHLVFNISTQRKVVVRDTSEYLSCCREHDCGFGYISTLVYGSGEYASGHEASVGAKADYMRLAGAGGQVDIAASERKQVRGYVAAVVTPHEVLRNMDDTRSRSFIAAGTSSFALGLAGFGLMTYGLIRGPQLVKQAEELTIDRATAPDKIRDANAMAIAGGVVGGVLTTAGIALLVVGVRGRQQKRFSAQPSPMGARMEVRF